MHKMKKSLIFQLVYGILILGLFYYLGFSIYFIMVIGVLFLLIILLKGKLYRKVKDFANKKFPSISKLPSWVQKLIIILAFILIYLLIKELIFFILKLGGIDVREIIVNSVNQSLM
ncbi:hypothetical protein M0R72_05000 [Candidatus Pacearchaeota archaeon]|nr:hypothetical protein [Candidatus Pacearchaeota archaeon]